MSDKPLPLNGVRVLDIATVLAAPVCATMMGDFGAEVVKIEEPTGGDFTRRGPGASKPGDRSLQWLQEGRNKKSVTLNLRTKDGQNLLKKLIPHFDVVVSNFRPPTLEKWGLAPETLREINPRAIFVFLTGYGLTGPNRGRGAFDRIASAYSGLTYVSGEKERPPVRNGYAMIDFMGAYLAAYAAMLALYHRDVNGGEGQIVDLALYEAGFRASEGALLDYGWKNKIREREGHRNLNMVPASEFDTSDGRRVALHAGTDALFAKLSKATGLNLCDDPRFCNRDARIANQDELYEIIGNWTVQNKGTEIVDILSAADVPSSLLMNIEDIANDAHYWERGTIVKVEDDQFGDLPMTAPLPHLSGTPGRIAHLGPELGSHNSEIWQGLLGLSDEELGRLKASGTI